MLVYLFISPLFDELSDYNILINFFFGFYLKDIFKIVKSTGLSLNSGSLDLSVQAKEGR